MLISKKYSSPHFQKESIPVEFVVLHYTAQSLKGSLDIFLNPKGPPLSCHLLIDRGGEIYELVSCSEGAVFKAFHAGKSFYKDSQGKIWKDFNGFSMGIELVNWNGNVFPFTEQQYQSLFSLLSHFQKLYPVLKKPGRILGHEQIAGFRGKKDPGALFDWKRLFKEMDFPSDKMQKWVEKTPPESFSFLRKAKKWNDHKARKVSLLMENSFLPLWIKKIISWKIIYLS